MIIFKEKREGREHIVYLETSEVLAQLREQGKLAELEKAIWIEKGYDLKLQECEHEWEQLNWEASLKQKHCKKCGKYAFNEPTQKPKIEYLEELHYPCDISVEAVFGDKVGFQVTNKDIQRIAKVVMDMFELSTKQTHKINELIRKVNGGE